jgi:hypothetical protein
VIVQAVYAVDRELGTVHVAAQLGHVMLGRFVPLEDSHPVVSAYDRPLDPRRPGWRGAAELALLHCAHAFPGVPAEALPGIVHANTSRSVPAVDTDPTPPHGIRRPAFKS